MAIKAYSYAKDGSKALSKNFHVREFKCKDGSDPIFIDDELVTLLQKIRDHFGKAVNINSAFRTASHNAGRRMHPSTASTCMAAQLTSGLQGFQWTRWQPTPKPCCPARAALVGTTRTVSSTLMYGR